MDCQRFRDDIDLCALGTLPPDEAERVRTHAATCDACRAELLAAEAAAAQLAFAVPRVSAPASMRIAVLEAVRRDAASAAPAPARARSGWLRVPRLSPRFGVLAAAVVLVPVAGLLAWSVALQREVNDLRDDTVQMQRRNDGLLLMAIPSALKADFQPAGDLTSGGGAVTWSPERGACYALFDRLPRPEPGTAYRLWYIVDSGRRVVDAGIVTPDADGRAEVAIDARNWRGQDYDLLLKLERSPHDPDAAPVLVARLRRPQ